MKASVKRVQQDLEYLATCSTGDNGITRLTFSPEENKARAYLKDQMLQAGMSVKIDAAGNVIGTFAGTKPDLPMVMVGSHIDSIREGGNFDGMAGVITGIEAMRLFRDKNEKPERSIQIVGFTGEENSRFYPGQFGSRAIAGTLEKNELYSTWDKDGVLLADAMKESGFDPEKIGEAAYAPGSLKVYLELHIEQCSVLERNHNDIGVVNCISGAAHHLVNIYGTTDHAGGTPMNMRSDAMCAAAEYTIGAEKAAVEIGFDTVATVGKLDVLPNIPNVIPGQVIINSDIRSTKNEYITEVMEKQEKLLDEICARRGCTYKAVRQYNSDPIPIREDLQELIEQQAIKCGYTNQRIYSGAGHDSIRINVLCPIAMIFIPSRNGLSHCPEEWTDYELVAKGTDVLYESLKELSKE